MLDLMETEILLRKCAEEPGSAPETELEAMIHKLSGRAGLFGLPTLSLYSAELERMHDEKSDGAELARARLRLAEEIRQCVADLQGQ